MNGVITLAAITIVVIINIRDFLIAKVEGRSYLDKYANTVKKLKDKRDGKKRGTRKQTGISTKNE